MLRVPIYDNYLKLLKNNYLKSVLASDISRHLHSTWIKYLLILIGSFHNCVTKRQLYCGMTENMVRIVRSDDFLPHLSPIPPYVGFGDEVVVEKSSNLWNIGFRGDL